MVKLYNKIKILRTLNTARTPAKRPATNGKPPVRTPADTARAKAIAVEPPALIKGLLRLIMSVRAINGSYTLQEGTLLPGFTGTPKYLGMDKDWNAPGWGFVLGSQDPDIRFDAARQGLLTQNKSLTSLFTQTRNEAINIRVNVEPAPDLKIQLDMKKETSDSYTEIYRYDSEHSTDGTGFASLSPSRTGSYTVSTISIRTAFNKSNRK